MGPVAKRKIAIFGGTFDPVHQGHLIMAEQCRDQAGLDQVWFVPAARPPHKLEHELTPFARRVEMLNLASAGQSAFRVEEIEKDRPGPSYTADTLEQLARRHAHTEWFFILGSDSLVDLPRWHEPALVLQVATLLLLDRPDSPLPAKREALAKMMAEQLGVSVHLQMVSAPLIGISSTQIRRLVHEGRSIRYLVPRAVECYIQEKKLYVAGPPSAPRQV